MAVIPRDEAEHVLDALIEAGHSATFMETKGGMLRQSQYSLFTAVSAKNVNNVCQIIRDHCTSSIPLDEDDLAKQEIIEDSGIQKIGGAVIFIWDLEKTEIY